MNNKNSLALLQKFLDDFADIANDLRAENEQLYYELTIDKVPFDELLSFEKNLQNYFIELSKKHLDYLTRKATDFNKLHHKDWEIEMASSENRFATIQKFFGFINLPNIEFNHLMDEFFVIFEKAFGDIQNTYSGYISPPYQYNIYCQHWQHLYIQTQKHHILVTFEANT